MRKMRVLLLTVLMLGLFSFGAYAQNNEDVILKEVKTGSMLIRSMQSADESNPIHFMSDSISDSGSYLSISSQTASSEVCDNLKLVIYVEEKQNGSWVTVDTFTFTKDNTKFLTGLATYNDISSYTEYRLTTFHYATLNGSTYMKINTSSSITTD